MASQWIISRRQDLTWLVGPAAASFAILAGFFILTAQMHVEAAIVIPVLYILWSLFFDGTHVFATYSRTFFDREFVRHSRSVLWYSIVFLVGGPVLILLYYWAAGIEETRGFFVLFNRFGLCWAYYHLVRQHWGFVSLYRRKNGETEVLGRRLDAALLAFGTLFPFAYYQAHHPQPAHIAELVTIGPDTWRAVVINLWIVAGVSGALSLLLFKLGDAATEGGRILRMTAIIVTATAIGGAVATVRGFDTTLELLSQLLLTGFLLTVVAQVVYLARAGKAGAPFNGPKWLCLGIVLATHNVVLLLPVPFLVAVVCVTILHNVQYHRIVQFHNSNQYGGHEASVRFGFAAALAQRLVLFAGLALAYSLFTTVPRAAAATFIESPLLNFTLTAFFWGIAFNHYYLDAIIWRPRGSAQLRQSLKMSEAGVTA
ncbi:MAG TPA: hypothetical protein VN700_17310 [Vicinamibacterales bacterium]|nr:hypothetical protein [Vicinamibacterales bacterium]